MSRLWRRRICSETSNGSDIFSLYNKSPRPQTHLPWPESYDLPLDDPVLNIRDTKVEVGKPIRLECTQSGSHPAANISWFINNKQSPAPISDTPPITADISATGAGKAAIFSRIFLLTVPEPTQALIKPPKGPGGLNLAAWAAAPAEKFPGGFHPVSDNSDFISIQATEVGRDEGDLQSARSRISILTNKSHFNQSAMTIRCEASIYKIWKRSVESTIRDDSPKLAQVLGSTLSQSQKDPILGPKASEVLGLRAPLSQSKALLTHFNHNPLEIQSSEALDNFGSESAGNSICIKTWASSRQQNSSQTKNRLNIRKVENASEALQFRTPQMPLNRAPNASSINELKTTNQTGKQRPLDDTPRPLDSVARFGVRNSGMPMTRVNA
ncbi:hypothetical protein HUJ04_000255 [Dendroctonus ponderosae]|nr:hypothetical protein HUJ04_000255 [Dendroctonus ponderosae]